MVSSTTRMRGIDERIGSRTGWAIAAWAALLVAAGPLRGAQEFPVRGVTRDLGATGPVRETPEGFAFQVDDWFGLFLPLQGAEVVEIDYRASGNLLLTWASAEGTTVPMPKLPPWHHQRLDPGVGRVTLDFRTTPDWGPTRVPLLYLEGSGSVVVTGIRARRVAPGPGAAAIARDQALRWAPLRVGHSTINWLDEPPWSESSGIPFTAVVGGAFLALALAGVGVHAGMRRRWVPAPLLAAAAVAAMLAGDVVFALRAAPVLALQPRTDAGDRLRRNFELAPEVGALAALARESLPGTARVGVQARESDWFGWESICFHLAPRPCVRVLPGAKVHEGLPGGAPMTSDQLDAVVYLHAGAPLLPGFAPTSSLAPGAFVARRR